MIQFHEVWKNQGILVQAENTHNLIAQHYELAWANLVKANVKSIIIESYNIHVLRFVSGQIAVDSNALDYTQNTTQFTFNQWRNSAQICKQVHFITRLLKQIFVN